MIHQPTGLRMTPHMLITFRDGTQEVIFILEDAITIPYKEEKI